MTFLFLCFLFLGLVIGDGTEAGRRNDRLKALLKQKLSSTVAAKDQDLPSVKAAASTIHDGGSDGKHEGGESHQSFHTDPVPGDNDQDEYVDLVSASPPAAAAADAADSAFAAAADADPLAAQHAAMSADGVNRDDGDFLESDFGIEPGVLGNLDTEEVRQMLAKALRDHGIQPGNGDDGEVRVVYLTVGEDGKPHVQVQDDPDAVDALTGGDGVGGADEQGSLELSPELIARALRGETIEQLVGDSEADERAADQQDDVDVEPVAGLVADGTGAHGAANDDNDNSPGVDSAHKLLARHRLRDLEHQAQVQKATAGAAAAAQSASRADPATRTRANAPTTVTKPLTVPQPPSSGRQSSSRQRAVAEESERLRAQHVQDAEFEARYFDGEHAVDDDVDVDLDPEEEARWSRFEAADRARDHDTAKAVRLLQALVDEYDADARTADASSSSGDHVDASSSPTGPREASLYALAEIAEWGERGHPVNWTLARTLYQRAADAGDADSQAALAFFYAVGRDEPRDEALALLYYTLAAQGGSVSAQLALGYRYMYGHGVPKSCERAVDYYDLVAGAVVDEISHTGLQPSGVAHRIVVQDRQTKQQTQRAEAMDYYQYSAQRGDPQAKVNLGTLYLDGSQGVQRDLDRALSFFQEAADMGDPSGLAQLGFMYEKGYADMVAARSELLELDNKDESRGSGSTAAAEEGAEQTRLSLERRAMHGRPDRERARTLYELALRAQPKNPIAQALLGILEAEDGNWSRAKTLLKDAASQGRADAQLQMGHMYFNGDGNLPQNYDQALQHYALAAHSGQTEALFFLAQMHRDGLGTPVDCKTAALLLKRVAERGLRRDLLEVPHDCWLAGDLPCALFAYELGAEQGVEVAMANAAHLYETVAADNAVVRRLLGNDTAEYQRRSVHLYRAAAEQQNALAHLKVGDAHFYGLGAKPSLSLAAKYYQAASDLRSAHATFNLGYMHQVGAGLPQDFHLAKRYYDLAADLNEDALPAVWLALTSLLVHAWGLRVYKMTLPQYDGIEIGLGPDFRLEWDTVLICFLSLVLFALWRVRRALLHHPPTDLPAVPNQEQEPGLLAAAHEANNGPVAAPVAGAPLE